MDMTPEKYIARLTEILQKKLLILQDILMLTEAQTGTINEDGIEDLRKLIDEKQVKIDSVNKLDEEFAVYFQRLKSSLKITRLDELDASGIKGAGRLKEATAEILCMIGRISEVEKQNNIKSKELLDRLGGEVKKINLGKRANSAYAHGPINIPSYFIDKKK